MWTKERWEQSTQHSKLHANRAGSNCGRNLEILSLTENKIGDLTIDEDVCYMNLSKEGALECADFTGYARDEVINKYKKEPKLIEETNSFQKWELISTDRFLSEKWVIKDKIEAAPNGSYRIGITMKGNGLISSLAGEDELKPGESFLIPASLEKYSLQNTGKDNLEIIWSLPPI